MWIAIPYSPASVGFASGTMSHLQGIVSVMLYCSKKDIKGELLALLYSDTMHAQQRYLRSARPLSNMSTQSDVVVNKPSGSCWGTSSSHIAKACRSLLRQAKADVLL